MPPPSNDAALQLQLLPGTFFVSQLKPTEPLPTSILASLQNVNIGGKFLSITRTNDEISIVGEVNFEHNAEDATWSCIKITGPMDFGLTGIMCDLSNPLKRAGIPIFALSTWNTDYVLVPKNKADAAVQALRDDGWKFT
ncbi:ACT domain-containing protein [Amylostereum chailletii]|nr:ACT domain-containing protein [Amylostereum chailletii]